MFCEFSFGLKDLFFFYLCVRLMRPATTHLVATYRESIVFGGHFYCLNSVRDTLRGMILEHYLGRDVTNTEHVKAAVLLMKSVCSLAARYRSGITEGERSKVQHHGTVLIIKQKWDYRWEKTL